MLERDRVIVSFWQIHRAAHSVYIPFNGRKRTEMGTSAEGGLTNKILGYIATEVLNRGSAT
jgi:hypothetical protein